MKPSEKSERHVSVYQAFIIFLTMTCGLLLGLSLATTPAEEQGRERLLFNADWRFIRNDPAGAQSQLDYMKIRNWVVPTGVDLVTFSAGRPARPEGTLGGDVSYTQTKFEDSGWRKLNLPHDWSIEGPFKQEEPGDTGKLPWPGVGWYRKHFTIPATDQGRQIYLDFDGAMSYASVWLNGQFVGGWPYGYTSFRLDLTPHVKFSAENILAVRLENPTESSRWYPGAGIYRNVWLVKTAPVHVAHWGVFVTTPAVSSSSAVIDVNVTLENRRAAIANVQVAGSLYELGLDGGKSREPIATTPKFGVRVPAGRQSSGSWSVRIPNPKMWNLKQPQRYLSVTTVEQDGKVIDSYDAPFGIRTVVFHPDKGLLLNGEQVRINGVCNHHDLGALGTAINTRALERQIAILQEMGANAIRTSHNPPAPELLELCDRMGMLVMDEAFDCWRSGKRRGDYGRVFVDWHEKDLRALVRRDRNHPSVILWSIGNEIREQGEPEGWKLAAHLAGIVREEDRTRPVTAGFNNVQSGYNGFQAVVDVVGYNYKPAEYGPFRQRNPLIPVMGSETSSCVSSRGEYFFPVSENKAQGRADFQVSSYDLYAPPWALPPDVEFRGLDEFPFTAGEFVWTGFDYLGEPTPYNSDSTNLLNFTDAAQQERMAKELAELKIIRVPSRSSYFGIIDLAGFKKDRFFIYQARWRPELPMAHILPHWNWPDRIGQITPVHVYSSGDEAELFLNGKSLGRKKRGPLEYRFRWDDVKYEPGEVKVIVFKAGKKWSEEALRTTGPASKLTLVADRTTLQADGQDLSFITVTITDKDGRMVPRSKNHVKFEISGAGTIAAVDNGDATSFEPFQAKERNAYNGLALVIVRSKAGEPGAITLRAQSDGLTNAEVTLRSTPR